MIACLDAEFAKPAPCGGGTACRPCIDGLLSVREEWRAGRALFMPGTTVPQGARFELIDHMIAVPRLARAANPVGEPSCLKEEPFWR